MRWSIESSVMSVIRLLLSPPPPLRLHIRAQHPHNNLQQKLQFWKKKERTRKTASPRPQITKKWKYFWYSVFFYGAMVVVTGCVCVCVCCHKKKVISSYKPSLTLGFFFFFICFLPPSSHLCCKKKKIPIKKKGGLFAFLFFFCALRHLS